MFLRYGGLYMSFLFGRNHIFIGLLGDPNISRKKLSIRLAEWLILLFALNVPHSEYPVLINKNNPLSHDFIAIGSEFSRSFQLKWTDWFRHFSLKWSEIFKPITPLQLERAQKYWSNCNELVRLWIKIKHYLQGQDIWGEINLMQTTIIEDYGCAS